MLLPLAVHRGQLGALRGHWRWLAVFACVEIILPWLFLSAAERRLSSSMSGLLIASVPIIGVALARLTGGGERLTPLRWAGLLGGLAGVALLAGPGRGARRPGVGRPGHAHRGGVRDRAADRQPQAR